MRVVSFAAAAGTSYRRMSVQHNALPVALAYSELRGRFFHTEPCHAAHHCQ